MSNVLLVPSNIRRSQTGLARTTYINTSFWPDAAAETAPAALDNNGEQQKKTRYGECKSSIVDLTRKKEHQKRHQRRTKWTSMRKNDISGDVSLDTSYLQL